MLWSQSVVLVITLSCPCLAAALPSHVVALNNQNLLVDLIQYLGSLVALKASEHLTPYLICPVVHFCIPLKTAVLMRKA